MWIKEYAPHVSEILMNNPTTYLPELPKEGGTVVNGKWVSKSELQTTIAKNEGTYQGIGGKA
jgi:hypothetical protein